jgi:cbb3-type cytochrome oxidase maturation protein
VVAAGFLGAFIWAVRSGQYEDTCTPSMRLLLDEGRDGAPRRPQRAVRTKPVCVKMDGAARPSLPNEKKANETKLENERRNLPLR